jgi:NAD(P)-dependent dehydrogenase (short-subunit alcohol dehydrogenase family)
MGRLAGKVAIVTGAGSVGPGWGNGKATAVLFAREGAKVFAVDRNAAAVEETRIIIASEGGECATHAADVTKEAQVKALVAKCVEAYGTVNVLHNNVGTTDQHGVVETSEEEWDRVLAINLKSMFLMCKHVVPHMERAGGGSIVNISSISAVRHNSRPFIAYYSSKAGILGLTRGVALDHAKVRVRCNAILPGMMNTPMMMEPAKGRMKPDELIGWLKARDATVPYGRAGTGWDVARAALFFASDDSDYVTGQTLVVDGGVTCKFS